MRTKNYIKKNNLTRKSKSVSIQQFQKEVTIKLLEMLMMIKLYHWKTHDYSTHKATDELYDKLNDNIDEFIEVLLGKTNSRIDLTNHNTFKFIDVNSQNLLQKYVKTFIHYLVNLNNNKALTKTYNSDLFNIRDEILSNLNQFLYLLSFK
jgi:DNA-binding ferritin-like protein